MAAESWSPERVLAARLTARRLEGPRYPDLVQTVESALAVQSQDVEPGSWAVAQCSAVGTAGDFVADYAAGRILRTHVLRPTWHYVTPGNLGWLLAVTGPRVAQANASLFGRIGVSPEEVARSLVAIEEHLASGQPATRGELREALLAAGVAPGLLRPTGASAVQTLAHLVMNAELAGRIVSGPPRGKQHTYMLVSDRAPQAGAALRAGATPHALAALVAGFLTAHGPATEKDVARWASLTLTQVRAGLQERAGDLAEIAVGELRMWRSLAAPPGRDRPGQTVQLLQSVDEYFMGFTHSYPRLDPSGAAAAAAAGRDRAFFNHVIAGGRIVGHWRRKLLTTRVDVEVALLGDADPALRDALRAALTRYADFCQRELGAVTFV